MTSTKTLPAETLPTTFEALSKARELLRQFVGIATIGQVATVSLSAFADIKIIDQVIAKEDK